MKVFNMWQDDCNPCSKFKITMAQKTSDIPSMRQKRRIEGSALYYLGILVIAGMLLHWLQIFFLPNLNIKYYITEIKYNVPVGNVTPYITMHDDNVEFRDKKDAIPIEDINNKIYNNDTSGITQKYDTYHTKKPHKHFKSDNASMVIKNILLWNDKSWAPLSYLGKRQEQFHRHRCRVNNCYVTDNREFFGGDLTKFDAIAFNGRNMNKNDLPKQRSPHQKYIYFNMESADNEPVCDKEFDNFFNWTATYKLDSDIYFGYILIKNASGHVVGPEKGMRWEREYPESPSKELIHKLSGKRIAAAWFASNCRTRSRRELKVWSLQKALSNYRLNIDQYGNCGQLVCPSIDDISCVTKLERDYYFYLSFENSFAEDYVTEKLLRAVNHNVVPIVFGGADYTRFLPPGSYLDARLLSDNTLAATINNIIKSPHLYRSYFRWKGSYKYSDALQNNVCAVCSALNDNKFGQYSVKKDFRRWWLPEYSSERC